MECRFFIDAADARWIQAHVVCSTCPTAVEQADQEDGAPLTCCSTCAPWRAAADAWNRSRVPAHQEAALTVPGASTAARQDATAEWTAQFLAALRDDLEPRGLVLHGAPRTGKTARVIGIMRQLLVEAAVPTRYVSLPELWRELRQAQSGAASRATVNELVAAPLLILDHLDRELLPAQMELLDGVISRRYNAMRPLIVATTHAPPGAQSRGSSLARYGNLAHMAPTTRPLHELIGDRLASRLIETCISIPV